MKDWIDLWLSTPEGKRTLKICLIIIGILGLILLINFGIDKLFG